MEKICLKDIPKSRWFVIKISVRTKSIQKSKLSGFSQDPTLSLFKFTSQETGPFFPCLSKMVLVFGISQIVSNPNSWYLYIVVVHTTICFTQKRTGFLVHTQSLNMKKMVASKMQNKSCNKTGKMYISPLFIFHK